MYISKYNASSESCVELQSVVYLQHCILKCYSIGQRGILVDAIDGELCCHTGKGLGKERVTSPGPHHSNPKPSCLGWTGQ